MNGPTIEVRWMRIAVSACLMGENCKYNGGNNLSPAVIAYVKGHDCLPVCPEVLAGAGIPRPCVELRNGRAVNAEGTDVDALYRAGAERALQQLREFGAECAILKSRSPTCGVHRIYDGTFSGKLIDGPGIFARMVCAAGIRVIDSDDLNGDR